MTAIPSAEPPVHREFSIRTLLMSLVLVSLLPGLVAVVGLVLREYTEQRTVLKDSAAHMAQALAQAVDGQLGQAEMVGLSLATSELLVQGRLADFHARARTLMGRSKLQGRVILSLPGGQQLLDTEFPWGQVLPLHDDPARIQEVAARRQASLSDAFSDPHNGQLHVAYDLPVLRDGQVVYVLSLWLLARNFDDTFHRQNLPAGWMAGIFDSTGVTLVRSHFPERFVGKRAVAPLVERMQREPRGVIETTTSEGVPALIAFSQVPNANWKVVAAIPQSLLHESLDQVVLLLGLLALLVLGLIAAVVWRMNQRISSAIVELAQATEALSKGQEVPRRRTLLREVNVVADTLLASVEQLRQRDLALTQAQRELLDRESRLASIIHNAPAALAIKDSQGRYVAANPKLQQLHHLSEDRIVGKTDFELYPLPVASRIREHEKKVLQTRISQTIHEEITIGDQSYIFMSQIFPVPDAVSGETAVCRICIDVTEEYRAKAELRSQETVYRELLDSMIEGCQILDAEWRYRYVNATVEVQSQRPAEELIGHTFMECWPMLLDSELWTTMQHCMQARVPLRLDNHFTAPNSDKESWFRLILQPVKEGIAIFSEDISSVVESKEALRRLNEQLEQKVAARTRDLELSNQALAEKESELRSVIDNVADSILTVDETGLIRTANRATERLFGYRSGELVGRPVHTILPEVVLDVPEAGPGAEAEEDGVSVLSVNRETEGRRKSGQPVDMHLTLSACSAQGQRLYIGILRDIGVQLRMLNELRQARHEAEQASRAKSTFLANMSHEIRTPINAIMGLTYLLEHTPLPDSAMAMVHKIGVAGRSLLGVINDILDFSKIEAGRIEIAQEPFRLGDLVESVSAIMSASARSKGLEWVVHPLPAGVEGLLGDIQRLEQILINLVGNAVKFTEHGWVELRIEVEARTDDEVRLRFAVRDTGIGIAPEKLGVIFESFSQEDATTTRRFGGTGLGLAICRRLIGLMGGEIGVDSRPGEGSEFWFRLTLVPSQVLSVQPLAAPAEAAQDLQGVRILAVDDSDINREVVQRILGDAGAQVTLAEDGQQALDWLQAHPDEVDLVLMDVQMPVLDGIETTRRLREQPRFADLPIVALTAGVLQTQHDAARAAGMNDFIAKPIDVPSTIALIQRLHRPPVGRTAAQAAPAPAAAPEASPDKTPVAASVQSDEADLLVLDAPKGLQIWTDTDTYMGYLRRFLQRYYDFVPNLQQQLETDPAAAKAVVHKLAGTAATMALPRLARAASVLEQALAQQAPWAEPWARLQAVLAVTLTQIQQYVDAGDQGSA